MANPDPNCEFESMYEDIFGKQETEEQKFDHQDHLAGVGKREESVFRVCQDREVSVGTPAGFSKNLISFKCFTKLDDLKSGNYSNFRFKVINAGSPNDPEHVELLIQSFFRNYVSNQKDIDALRNELSKKDLTIASLNKIIEKISNKLENSAPDYFELLRQACVATGNLRKVVKQQVLDAVGRNTIDEEQRKALLEMLNF